MAALPFIELEAGWAAIETGCIHRLEQLLGTQRVLGGGGELFTKTEYSDLYTIVYRMCIQRTPNNWTKQLYLRYQTTVQSYCVREVRPALLTLRDRDFLTELQRRWHDHIIYSKWFTRLFTYLDRYYVRLHMEEPLKKKAMSIFYDHVYTFVQTLVQQSMLREIENERKGIPIDGSLLRDLMDMFLELGHGSTRLYENEMENPVLQATKEYYAVKAGELVGNLTLPAYMIQVEEYLEEEKTRCENYLHRDTKKKMEAMVVRSMIRDRQKELVTTPTPSGLDPIYELLKNDSQVDLSRLYRLMGKVEEGLRPLTDVYKKFVVQEGNEMVETNIALVRSNVEKSAKAGVSQAWLNQALARELSDNRFMNALIDMHDHYRKMNNNCFNQDFLFQKAVKEGFEIVLNKDRSGIVFPELISSFCDRILKKSSNHLKEEEIITLIHQIVEIFSYLSDKDVFADIYRTQLAKRLLYSTSASEDVEKSMIAQLKLKCGHTFTAKLEGMMTDLTSATTMQQNYKNFTAGAGPVSDIEFIATVLMVSHWPTYPETKLVLPPSLNVCVQKYETFYKGQTQSRKLTWVHSLGAVTVTASLGRKHDLMCNTIQASILLLFNESEKIKAKQIIETLRMDEAEAFKYMGTLALGKFQILVKEGEGKIDTNTDLVVNKKFSFQQRRIKLPTPAQEETYNKDKIKGDRSYQVHAAIVRIMKARKELNHRNLVSEVVTQLTSFKPDMKIIKTGIEDMITREYLKRKEDDNDVYQYMA